MYFYRPLGFLCAKAAYQLRITPSQLTILGMLLGVVSGTLFYFNQSTRNLIVAALLLIFSGVLDSADGQLARLSGQCTKFGLVLDGLCDNLVFIAVYVGCTLTLVPQFGLKIWALAVLAGMCHSMQSSILDFYNREYLFFGCGLHNGDYWNPSPEEARTSHLICESKLDKVAWKLRYSWLWQQTLLSTRLEGDRLLLRKLVQDGANKKVTKLYRIYNRKVLRLWRPLGANIHTMMIIIFAALKHFELYLLAIDIVFLNLLLLVARYAQRLQDKKLFKNLAIGGAPKEKIAPILSA